MSKSIKRYNKMVTNKNMLESLKKIREYTRYGDTFLIYDYANQERIHRALIPILKNVGIIKINKTENRRVAYIWNTIEPNIHMAEKLIEKLRDYNKKNNEKAKLRKKQSNAPLLAPLEEKWEEQDDVSNDEMEKSSFKPVEICDIEICDRGEIENLKSEIERLNKLNKHLEHQLDYAQNFEVKEVEKELVKAMNLNSEKSLIIGNIAMQLDKKDEQIKTIDKLDNVTKALVGIVFSQNKIVDKLTETVDELKQKPKVEKKPKTQEKSTRSFSILWGLLTIKNA
jgi:hypothetical protein